MQLRICLLFLFIGYPRGGNIHLNPRVASQITHDAAIHSLRVLSHHFPLNYSDPSLTGQNPNTGCNAGCLLFRAADAGPLLSCGVRSAGNKKPQILGWCGLAGHPWNKSSLRRMTDSKHLSHHRKIRGLMPIKRFQQVPPC